jgi:hypothetical protein
MKRDYIMERSGYDDDYYYDDIYPSILKQQPSHFKSLLLGLCLRFMHFWHKVCYIKKHRVACDNRILLTWHK